MSEQIVIGAHGTLKSWVQKRVLNTENVRILVFDEADEMLKVGDTLVLSACTISSQNRRVVCGIEQPIGTHHP